MACSHPSSCSGVENAVDRDAGHKRKKNKKSRCNPSFRYIPSWLIDQLFCFWVSFLPRHCPFAHRNVSAERQEKLERDPYVIEVEYEDEDDEKRRQGSQETSHDSANYQCSDWVKSYLFTNSICIFMFPRRCVPDIEDSHSTDTRSSSAPCRAIILFWSGGKDSLLAYYTLKRKIDSENRYGESTMIVLLSTFDGRREFVANQEVSFELIRRQVSRRHCRFI